MTQPTRDEQRAQMAADDADATEATALDQKLKAAKASADAARAGKR